MVAKVSDYPTQKRFFLNYFDPFDLKVKRVGPTLLQACIRAAEEIIIAGVPWVSISDATAEEIGRQELAEQAARKEANKVRFWQ